MSERPLLDALAFRFRLEEEVARVRRAGGFLSLAVLRIEAGRTAPIDAETRLARVARRLRDAVRLHDVLAGHGANLVLLMPETTASEAVRAGERLLALVAEEIALPAGHALPRDSAGVATAYGEVEGAASPSSPPPRTRCARPRRGKSSAAAAWTVGRGYWSSTTTCLSRRSSRKRCRNEAGTRTRARSRPMRASA
jgi:hypothetical protein